MQKTHRRSLCLILLLIWVLPAYSQKADFSSFVNFIADTQRIPASLKENCNWHYAVVKVMSDKNGKVTNYEVLNDAEEDLKKSFSFLVGYNFDKLLAVNGRPVVFILTLFSRQEDCDGSTKTISPSDAISAVFILLNEQKKKQPDTIFLYDVILKGIYSNR